MCENLARVLPTWAEEDTEQSKEEGYRFLTVFYGVCGRKQ